MRQARQVGPYRLVRELGRGGMGAVYLAQDAQGEQVALKLMHVDLAADPDLLARFELEGQALARLDHPNLTALRGRGREPGGLWLALDYVPGENLAERIAREGPLPGWEAVELLLPLCEAVAHAHEAGLLHRDLKPANVLLRASDGRPFVTDFGLARRLDRSQALSNTGEILGSPGYLAPEQCGSGLSVGPATDVYGLGALLYATLTGAPPFQAATLIGSLEKVLSEEPAPPSQRAPGVPPGLDAVCLRCLRKDPAQRYASARELREALAGSLHAEAPAARRSGRGPWLAAGALVACGALAGGALALRGPSHGSQSSPPTELPTEPQPSPERASPTPADAPESGAGWASDDWQAGLTQSAAGLELPPGPALEEALWRRYQLLRQGLEEGAAPGASPWAEAQVATCEAGARACAEVEGRDRQRLAGLVALSAALIEPFGLSPLDDKSLAKVQSDLEQALAPDLALSPAQREALTAARACVLLERLERGPTVGFMSLVPATQAALASWQELQPRSFAAHLALLRLRFRLGAEPSEAELRAEFAGLDLDAPTWGEEAVLYLWATYLLETHRAQAALPLAQTLAGSQRAPRALKLRVALVAAAAANELEQPAKALEVLDPYRGAEATAGRSGDLGLRRDLELSRALLALGRLPEAKAALAPPLSAEGALGAALLRHSGDLALAQGQDDAGEKFLLRAAKAERDPRGWLRNANVYRRHNKRGLAARDLERALAARSLDAALWRELKECAAAIELDLAQLARDRAEAALAEGDHQRVISLGWTLSQVQERGGARFFVEGQTELALARARADYPSHQETLERLEAQLRAWSEEAPQQAPRLRARQGQVRFLRACDAEASGAGFEAARLYAEAEESFRSLPPGLLPLCARERTVTLLGLARLSAKDERPAWRARALAVAEEATTRRPLEGLLLQAIAREHEPVRAWALLNGLTRNPALPRGLAREAQLRAAECARRLQDFEGAERALQAAEAGSKPTPTDEAWLTLERGLLAQARGAEAEAARGGGLVAAMNGAGRIWQTRGQVLQAQAALRLGDRRAVKAATYTHPAERQLIPLGLRLSLERTLAEVEVEDEVQGARGLERFLRPHLRAPGPPSLRLWAASLALERAQPALARGILASLSERAGADPPLAGSERERLEELRAASRAPTPSPTEVALGEGRWREACDLALSELSAARDPQAAFSAVALACRALRLGASELDLGGARREWLEQRERLLQIAAALPPETEANAPEGPCADLCAAIAAYDRTPTRADADAYRGSLRTLAARLLQRALRAGPRRGDQVEAYSEVSATLARLGLPTARMRATSLARLWCASEPFSARARLALAFQQGGLRELVEVRPQLSVSPREDAELASFEGKFLSEAGRYAEAYARYLRVYESPAMSTSERLCGGALALDLCGELAPAVQIEALQAGLAALAAKLDPGAARRFPELLRDCALVEALGQRERYAELLPLATRVLPGLPPSSERARLLAWRAKALLATNRGAEQAQADFEQAVAEDPTGRSLLRRALSSEGFDLAQALSAALQRGNLRRRETRLALARLSQREGFDLAAYLAERVRDLSERGRPEEGFRLARWAEGLGPPGPSRRVRLDAELRLARLRGEEEGEYDLERLGELEVELLTGRDPRADEAYLELEAQRCLVLATWELRSDRLEAAKRDLKRARDKAETLRRLSDERLGAQGQITSPQPWAELLARSLSYLAPLKQLEPGALEQALPRLEATLRGGSVGEVRALFSLLLAQGRVSDARQALELGLARFPADDPRRASLLLFRQDIASAYPSFAAVRAGLQEAHRSASRPAWRDRAALLIAEAFLQAGQGQAAQPYLERVLSSTESRPLWAEALTIEAEIFLGRSDPTSAQIALERIAAARSAQPPGDSGLELKQADLAGRACLRLGQLQRALDEGSRLIELRSDLPQGYRLRAQALYQEQGEPAARAWLQSVLQRPLADPLRTALRAWKPEPEPAPR